MTDSKITKQVKRARLNLEGAIARGADERTIDRLEIKLNELEARKAMFKAAERG